jgi:superfamily II DNA or RNA helicase
LIGDEFNENKTYESDKNERIIALCEENSKVAIICRYNTQIDYLAQILAKYRPFIIRGDVKNRDKVCLEAEKAQKAIVLIQADSCLGYQLPSFELCVFVSMSYSYVNYEQMCGRFLRMDKPSRTTFIYLLTEGNSVDQAVYDAVKAKEDFSIELYAKKRSTV